MVVVVVDRLVDNAMWAGCGQAIVVGVVAATSGWCEHTRITMHSQPHANATYINDGSALWLHIFHDVQGRNTTRATAARVATVGATLNLS